MPRKLIGFILFAATSLSLLGFAIAGSADAGAIVVLALVTLVTLVALYLHFREVSDKANLKPFALDKAKLLTFIYAFVAVVVTWFLNTQMKLGAFVANGSVGLIAAILLAPAFAGTTYAASFVGMASLAIIPNVGVACFFGAVVGIVLVFTGEIYAGIGGKGGTTAACASEISHIFLGLFK